MPKEDANNNNEIIYITQEFLKEFKCFTSEGGIRILTDEELAQITAGSQSAETTANRCLFCNTPLQLTVIETSDGPRPAYKCENCGKTYVIQ